LFALPRREARSERVVRPATHEGHRGFAAVGIAVGIAVGVAVGIAVGRRRHHGLAAGIAADIAAGIPSGIAAGISVGTSTAASRDVGDADATPAAMPLPMPVAVPVATPTWVVVADGRFSVSLRRGLKETGCEKLGDGRARGELRCARVCKRPWRAVLYLIQ
jgi:hypothetical protein